MQRVPIVERAFQLARSGECRGMVELHACLRKEQYTQIDEYLGGRAIKQQLRDICANARGPSAPSGHEAG